MWADGEGELNVLDGYCRHMGGDITQGTVKGDQIACPFHDWRWGGDGKCKQIPYARRVPLRARTQRYETAIVNDQLLIWHDVEGSKAAIAALRSGRARTDGLITHRFPLDDYASALDTLRGDRTVHKIIIECWQG